MKAQDIMTVDMAGVIPVLDTAEKPIGVVTDRDIACRIVAEGKDALETTARECMSGSPITVFAGGSVLAPRAMTTV